MSCCGASSITGSTAARAPTLLVEFLFLDDSICRPCTETADALEEAIEIAAAPLAAMGVGMRVEKVHVGDEAAAKAHQLLISPTIRINGADIDPARTQGECDTCGDLAGGTTTINCRR